MKTELFLVEVEGRYHAYTKEVLEAAEYKAVEGSKTLNEATNLMNEIYGKDYGITIVGQWVPFATKQEWLDGDNQKVESAITEKRAPFQRHDERWDAVVVCTGVTQWGFTQINPTWTATEEGLSQMPLRITTLIKNLVIADYYGSKTDPLYQMPSSQS